VRVLGFAPQGLQPLRQREAVYSQSQQLTSRIAIRDNFFQTGKAAIHGFLAIWHSIDGNLAF
jgi:hypothetical protein